MDHLLLPEATFHEPFEVPYVCGGMEYVPPFLTFPDRMGWDVDTVTRPFEHGKTRAEVDAFLQVWLFFGLLRNMFGPLFQPTQFVRPASTGGWSITTQPLRAVWADFGHSTTSMTRETLLDHRHHAHNFLHAAEDYIKAISAHYGHDQLQVQSRARNQSLVELSIVYICRFLAVHLLFDDLTFSNYGANGILELSLLHDGWCPSQVQRLSRELNPESLYLIRHMERPLPSLNHSSCSLARCSAAQVELCSYKTKHIRDDNCGFLEVDVATLYDILKTNELPLIESRALLPEDSLRIIASDKETRYVAISHVWSHGLGNAEKNALPRCQLFYLNQAVNALYPAGTPPVPYWIDTISCPTEPDEATQLAITLMRKTYRAADKVLVLDADLLAVEAKTLQPVEKLLRIVSSMWTQRLWTLQEGALARQIYFQFADGAIDLEETQQELLDNAVGIEYDDIHYYLVELRYAWEKGKAIPKPDLLYLLSRAMRYRSTSVPSDEALCMATLAGLNMDEIAAAPQNQQLSKFWSLVRQPPHWVPFWSGPRLPNEGFGWAPATFLGGHEFNFAVKVQEFESPERKLAELSNEGLLLESSGILLSEWEAPVENYFWVRDTNSNWFYVDFRHVSGDSMSTSTHDVHLAPQSALNNTSLRLALILQDKPRLGNHDRAETQSPKMAMLVSVTDNSLPGLDARFIASAWMVMAETTMPVHQREFALVQRLAGRLDSDRPRSLADVQNRMTSSVLDHTRNSEDSCDGPGQIRWLDNRWSFYTSKHTLFEGLMLPQSQLWCIR